MNARFFGSTSATPHAQGQVASIWEALIDDRFEHPVTQQFRERSPYQPAVGDPIPLDFPNLRALTTMPFTSPPWRIANRLDQTRHIRLAGDWAGLPCRVRLQRETTVSTGLISADTVIAKTGSSPPPAKRR